MPGLIPKEFIRGRPLPIWRESVMSINMFMALFLKGCIIVTAYKKTMRG
jgi:hypothetical protein